MSNDKAIVVCKRQVVDFVGLTHGHSAIEMTTYVAGSPLASIALHPDQARELIKELAWRIEEIEKGAQGS